MSKKGPTDEDSRAVSFEGSPGDIIAVMVIPPKLYQRLTSRVAEFCSSCLPKLKELAAESPLRAVCLEFDDQCTLNLRAETQAQWIERNLKEATYRVEGEEGGWTGYNKEGLTAAIAHCPGRGSK